MKYFLYIVRCSDSSLYTGITTDVHRRINEHNGKGNKGAKYTSMRQPVVLVYSAEFENRSASSKEESRIKKFTKDQKEKFIKKYDTL